MKPNKYPITQAPPAIQTAFAYVREKFPSVNKVNFDKDTRWHYSGDKGFHPKFGKELDVGILEDAQSALEEIPVTYHL